MLLAEIDKYDVFLTMAIFGGIGLFAVIVTIGILIDNGSLKKRSKAVRKAQDAARIAELQLQEQEFRHKADQLVDKRLGR